MNSRLQGALLRELFVAVPDTNQLWLATHSPGMMRAARDLYREKTGEVIFLDFGGREFDEPQVVVPEAPTRVFWENVLGVAFDDFADLIAPELVVICEGSRIGDGGPSEGLDARIYSEICADEFPDARFIPGGNANQVENDRLALVQAMQHLVKGTAVRRLIDSDDMTDGEIVDKRKAGISVLGRRNLEGYLFDDEVVESLFRSCGLDGKFAEYQNEKGRIVADALSRGRAADDLKAVAGPLKVAIVRLLTLRRPGSTVKEFMRVHLAPLLKPGVRTYEELKESVFTL